MFVLVISHAEKRIKYVSLLNNYRAMLGLPLSTLDVVRSHENASYAKRTSLVRPYFELNTINYRASEVTIEGPASEHQAKDSQRSGSSITLSRVHEHISVRLVPIIEE